MRVKQLFLKLVVLVLALAMLPALTQAQEGAPAGLEPATLSAAAAGTTSRVTVALPGLQGNGGALHYDTPSVSANGRYVAFASNASNLAHYDHNGQSDVFLRDRQTGVTTLVSVAEMDTDMPGDGFSFDPSISDDGRFVAYVSSSDGACGTNNGSQIYVYDRLQESDLTCASLGQNGVQADAVSSEPSISADGRFVAFTSHADNLVSGVPTSVHGRIFVRDRQTNTTTLVSGINADGDSYNPSISANGRYVAFLTFASNLVAGDTNGTSDILVYDRNGGATRRVTITPGGVQANQGSYEPDISADGRFVTFSSLAGNLVGDTTPDDVLDVYVQDAQGGGIRLVSVAASAGPEANSHSAEPTIDAGGRFVAFTSSATNLVTGDTNNNHDVFVRDLGTNQTFLISRPAGGQGNASSTHAAISTDASVVVYHSFAGNLVAGDTNGVGDVFVSVRLTGQTTTVSAPSREPNGDSLANDVSGNGRYVAFTSYANNLIANQALNNEAFIRDQTAGVIERAAVTADGVPANGDSWDATLSADGRYVAFTSWASNLVAGDTNGVNDIFVRDRQTGEVTRVSVASGGGEADSLSIFPVISGNGRHVAFSSAATNLDGLSYEGLFVHNLNTRQTTRVSVTTDGARPNGNYREPSISADGRYVAFPSGASNLVAGDTNGKWDIFVRDMNAGVTTRISIGLNGAQSNGDSGLTDQLQISADGRYVAFTSWASNLVAGDTNEKYDVFVYDRNISVTTRVSVGLGGVQGNDHSWDPAISDDGRYVAFESTATNFPGGVAASPYQIYVHDRTTGTTTHVSVATDGNKANDVSQGPLLSGDGRYVVFTSWAGNLVSGDANGYADVYIRDRGASSSGAALLLSATSSGTVSGITFGPEDILRHDPAAESWSLFFDGSAVGFTKPLAAFALRNDGSLLLTPTANLSLPGLGAVTPWDVVRFIPNSPGNYTAGAFQWYIDSSDVGLTKTGEKIDALELTPDGRVLVSPFGSAVVTAAAGGNLKAQDEDVLAFTPSSTGQDSEGTWGLYFNGTATSGLGVEDVTGSAVDASGNIYLSLQNGFNVNEVTGGPKDILILRPAGGGGYTVERFWRGPDHGFNLNLSGIEVIN